MPSEIKLAHAQRRKTKLTNEIVGREGIGIPYLEMKSGRNFLFRLVPREETRLGEKTTRQQISNHCSKVLLLMKCLGKKSSLRMEKMF
jgi:hypothetical protein